MMCYHRFILGKKCTILVGDTDNGEAMHVWSRGYMGNVFLPLNFGVNLKLFLKTNKQRLKRKSLKHNSSISRLQDHG